MLCQTTHKQELHPNYPIEGLFAATEEEVNTEAWREPLHEMLDRINSRTPAKYMTVYKGKGGNNSLNHHIQRCHGEELDAMKTHLVSGSNVAQK
jgi:hypothetical protein